MELSSEKIIDQIKLLEKRHDNAGLDKLIKQYAKQAPSEIKDALAGVYSGFYGQNWMDYAAEKFNGDAQIYIEETMSYLDRYEMFAPAPFIGIDRSHWYLELADIDTEEKKKLEYYFQADKALKRNLELYPGHVESITAWLEVYIARINLTNTMQPDEYKHFGQLLNQLLNQEIERFDEKSLSDVFYILFELRKNPFEKIHHVVSDALVSFNQKADELVFRQSETKVFWAEPLAKCLLENDHPDWEMNWKKLIELLSGINITFERKPRLWTTLGHNLHNLATQQNSSIGSERRTLCLEHAIDIFVAGTICEPMAWTFPLYATKALLEIAKDLLSNNDLTGATKAYEEGVAIYDKIATALSDNFSVSKNFGEYLLSFNRLIYQFSNKDLLQKAEKQFRIAIKTGDCYYFTPYFGLAKTLLFQNQKSKCLEILMEYKEVYLKMFQSADSHREIFEDVFKDTEFEPIFDELRAIVRDEDC